MTAGTRHVPDAEEPTAQAPAPPARAERRGPRGGVLAALAGLVLAGVVVAVVLASGGEDRGSGGATTGTVAPEKPAGSVIATAKAPRPTGLTVADGVVWVISSTTPAVTRIGAKSGQKQTPLTGLLDGNSGIAAGLDAVWITNQRGQSLFRIDPKTRQPVGAPTSLAPGQPFVVDVGGGPCSWACAPESASRTPTSCASFATAPASSTTTRCRAGSRTSRSATRCCG